MSDDPLPITSAEEHAVAIRLAQRCLLLRDRPRFEAVHARLMAYEAVEHRQVRHDLTDVYGYLLVEYPVWAGWIQAQCPPGPAPRQLVGLMLVQPLAGLRAEATSRMMRALRALGYGVERGLTTYEQPTVSHRRLETMTAHRRLAGWSRVREVLARSERPGPG